MERAEITRREKDSEEQFLAAFGPYHELAASTLNALDEGLGILDGQRLKASDVQVRTWLAVRHRNALTAALTLLNRGYATSSAVEARAAFEAWAIQKHLAKHPDQAVIYSEIDLTEPFRPKDKPAQFSLIWKELEGAGQTEAPRV